MQTGGGNGGQGGSKIDRLTDIMEKREAGIADGEEERRRKEAEEKAAAIRAEELRALSTTITEQMTKVTTTMQGNSDRAMQQLASQLAVSRTPTPMSRGFGAGVAQARAGLPGLATKRPAIVGNIGGASSSSVIGGASLLGAGGSGAGVVGGPRGRYNPASSNGDGSLTAFLASRGIGAAAAGGSTGTAAADPAETDEEPAASGIMNWASSTQLSKDELNHVFDILALDGNWGRKVCDNQRGVMEFVDMVNVPETGSKRDWQRSYKEITGAEHARGSWDKLELIIRCTYAALE